MLVLCSVYAIMIFSEICGYLGSGLKVPTEITDFYSLSMRHCTRNEKSKFNFMLVLCSVYAIMIFSEICEYLGSGLKVPTKINGFVLSFDATLYQKRKIECLILCWEFAQFMLL